MRGFIARTRASGRLSDSLVSGAFALVATRWGWMIIGIGLLIGGLIWGLQSQQVSYMQSDSQTKYDIGTGTTSGNVYINVDGTDNYYVAFSSDFIIPPDTLKDYASFTFIARTDTSTLSPSLTAQDGTTISSAHKIEKLVFYNQQDQIVATYMTTEYRNNPNGYTINNWSYASLLMSAGALCAVLMLFLIIRSRRRQKLAIAAERAALEARPSPFARELAEEAREFSQQPYQGTANYPQNTPDVQVSTPYQEPQR